MKCPRCDHEFEVQSEVRSGGYLLSFPNVKNGTSDSNPNSSENPNRAGARVRGKGREYSEAFTVAWKAYPRGEEKFQAYGQWIIEARRIGGETRLLPLILAALKWQAPLFHDGTQFFPLPYFERYLKHRKWEDERPATKTAVVRASIDRAAESTDKYLARLNASAGKQATPEEIRALRGVK